ncbi:EAL domain-containing response regulator [Gilvimarinus sp. 1_MG-2023]|uniref:EAL domain-containing response regulator n=3 Tax=unclassified Gilvimarinus TaxID=2642066 RepID=UPI0026E2C132|nr:EAL domain-containing protein [Gilvimarinus sp. 1_MG-2023]MDO6748181.1 EAL domain-containing protein [Gilvimarinus sp. 1_MG-2023]
MNPNDTIRLLILNDSQQEAERLISMLQNAGKPNRAQHVTNADSLAKLLEEQAWDLLIAHEKTQNLAPSDAVQQIRRLNKDVPVLLLSDEEGSQVVVEGLKLGAADVIRLDEDQHLLLVINREMLNRKQRQEKRIADRQFRESERRAQSLLDSSRDAIAYVQDGLYLYANESFAELFAYEDKDDIDCMPIMDMVAERDQKNLKDFIKQFTLKGAGAESSQLKFQGIKQDGSITPIALEVSHATYDDEPCLQFLAKATKLDAVSSEEIEAAKSLDVVTGLYNRSYMMSATDKIIDNISDDQNRALLYIDIDDYTESVQGKFGVSGADAAIADLAQLINKVTKKGELLARFGDNSFTLLTGTTTTSEAVKRATKINAAIAEHIIDIKNVTLQVTASIGVSVINENSSKAETAIEQALDAMEKARASDECTAMLYEPPMSDEERQEKNMIADVRHALDNDMFHLMFQPIISLRGSDEEHYEVLVRLKSGSGEQLPPEQFIDAAIDAGIGGKMDRWIILESIKMLSEHRAQGNHTKLIVNLNRVSVCDESLVPWLGVAFKAAGLSADAIAFQVQERDITNHLNAAKALNNGLDKLGSMLSISNFGCSLNPFNALKHVNAKVIKVDGSFTQDIQSKSESPEGLTQLLGGLHEQEKITIVPFVENASVLSTLWQAGVHYIQGHYLQEPTESMSYDFNMEG